MKNKSSTFKNILVSVTILAIILLINIQSKVKAADSDYFSIDLKTTTSSILSGSEVRLSLDYSFTSLTSEYSDVTLEIDIPSELVGTSISAANMPVVYTTGETSSLVPVITANKIKYTVPSGKKVEPGYTATIDLIKATTTRFVTLPGDVNFIAKISGKANNTLQSLSDTQPITINVLKDWKVNKTARYANYNEGSYVRYRMYLSTTNRNGALSAKSFTVTDVLPDGLTFVAFDDPNDPNINLVLPDLNPSDNTTWAGARTQPFSNIPSSYPAGSVSHSQNTITWTIPDTGVMYNNNSYLETSFWVKIDDDLGVTNSNSLVINNTAQLNTTYIDNTSVTNNGTGGINIIEGIGNPNNNPDKLLYFTNGGYGNDTSTVYYRILADSFRNESTQSLMNYTITDVEDDWSDSMTLKDIMIPGMSYGTSSYFTYSVYFLNNSGNVISSTLNRNTSTSRTFNAPINAKGYRIVFNSIPRTEETASLRDIIIGFEFNSNKLEEEGCIYNRAKFDYTLLNQPNSVIKTSRCNSVSEIGAARATLSKGIANKKSIYQYEDIVNFTMSYSNSLYSGKNIKNAVFYDLLPVGLRYIPNSTVGNGVEFLEVIDNYKGTGRQRIKWRALTDITPNASGNFAFDAFVSEDIISGINTNTSYLLADTPLDNDFNFSSYPKDTTDIDDDGNTNEPALSATTTFDAVPFTGILVVKEVKGDQDTSWSRYPDYGTVSAAGQFQYRLTIKNLSNQPIKEINIIDILPKIGDKGVLVSTSRNSEWTPYLKAAIPANNGFTIQYSTSDNPNRGAIGRPSIGEPTTTWLSTPPGDITQVRSIKIEHTGSMAVGTSKSFTFDMISPFGAPRNGEIAWNSLAMQAKSNNNALTVPTEPKKVGIKTKEPINNMISGFTWHDRNKNGRIDAQEPGINGVKVYLLDENGNRILDTNNNPIYTVSSFDNLGNPGKFAFVNIDDGNYSLEFIEVDGYGLTIQPEPADPMAVDKSDYNPLTRKTTVFNVHHVDVLHIDAGYTLTEIGDFIFNDSNRNGIQDNGEVGIENIKVNLLKDGNIIATKLTDTNGKYLFSGLLVGTYTIEIEKPLLYTFSPVNAGSDDQIDSDFTPISLQKARVDVTTQLDSDNFASSNLSIDGGMYLGNSSISGVVWDDLKRDNVFGNKPTGSLLEDFISGVTFKLYNSENTLVLSSTSNTQGEYLFDNLPKDTYKIEIIFSNDYTLVVKNFGSNTTIDSDFNQTTNYTDNIVLEEDENKENIDAGLKTSGNSKIKGFAYLDDNYNCSLDVSNSENTYQGLNVELIEDGLVVATTQTGVDGKYEFNNLYAQQYEVRFYEGNDLIYIGNGDATKAEPNSELIVNAEVTTNNTVLDNIPSGGVCIQYEKSGIGDYVWLDENRNGLQDIEEHGFENAIVRLFKNGSLSQTKTTNANGFYFFDDIEANNNYYVEIELPSDDYIFTTPFIDDGSGSNTKNSIFTPEVGNSKIGKSSSILLPPQNTNNQFDAGVCFAPSKIGNRIWFDDNQNGLQDSTEFGISNISVELYKKVNNDYVLIDTKVTNSSGYYQFIDLNPGDYKVKIDKDTIPSFLTLTTLNQGSDVTIDSDFNRIDYTKEVVLEANILNNDIDVGLITKEVTIGDYLWIDLDRDGIQDGNDSPLTNTTVVLYKVINGNKVQVNQTTTDNNGIYYFYLLSPYSYDGSDFKSEKYYVGFDVPAGMVLSDNLLAGSDTTKDNNFSVVTENSVNLNLSNVIEMSLNNYDDKILDIDGAVEYQPSKIEGNVWKDKNRDGVYGSAEPIYPGISMTLLQNINGTWTSIASTTTDINGYYYFDELNPGEYKVQISILNPSIEALDQFHATSIEADNDFCPTVQLSDDYAGLDSVNCGGTLANQTDVITLGYNQRVQDIDAGIQEKYSSIGDYAWIDYNRNGVQDNQEPVAAGVSILLLDENKQTIKSTISDENGKYLFKQLDAGKYYIEVNITSQYNFTQKNVTSTGIDSIINPATGQSDEINLAIGQKNTDTDIGLLYKPSSIGDYIWNDINEDGLQDSNEQGIENIEVALQNIDGSTVLDVDGNPINNTTTDANGKYTFEKLNPGTYQVVLVLSEAQKLFYQPTLKNTGNVLNDSDLDINYKITNIILNANESNVGIDAGLFKRKASLSGNTWLDSNKNGIHEIDEMPLSDIQVKLYIKDNQNNSNNYTYIKTINTDNTGNYLFDNLESQRTYKVEFAKPNNYDFTNKNSGNDATIDSDVYQSNGYTDEITLNPSDDKKNVDAGYKHPFGIIGNYVWIDDNGNGIQDNNESGINNVDVMLLDQNKQIIKKTKTNSSGLYMFDNLVAATYYIKFDLLKGYEKFTIKNANTNIQVDSDVDFDGYSNKIDLNVDEHNLSIDAGLIPLKAKVGDYVWYDKNQNGMQDKNESGISNVKVSLYNKKTNKTTYKYTDKKGYYLFDNLNYGDYCLSVSLAKDYRWTQYKKANVSNSLNSDFDSNHKNVCVTLSPGESNLDIDAGMIYYTDFSNSGYDITKITYLLIISLISFVALKIRRKYS